ncbi:4-hydroxy-tetrahydrodipicolinate synthase [Paucimonas lemoignei]|uniref:4-hydroxy-tetrahydrodipicolinate synthase n=1 Tax=Paucimonas lemoignei TaxID=29443 RepID=A0A4R3HS85_PAULE|nr:4-hydroxy-tetrahydrodipicolinate synthase [Paucimonas lemoignei]TCS33502.1 4-hydroxy-tetrahydrodipicolinate synthase [Paucimonas lemoignei]
MTAFEGIWVPLVTPFRNQQIDFAALKALAREMARAGVSGLVACGSTGEAAALDKEEQLTVLDAMLEAVPACQVMMGLSDNNLPAALAQLQRIQQRPVAGVLVPPPSYIRPSQAGIIEYFHRLADAAIVPLVLYNIPYRTGVTLRLETIRTLARHPRIQAIKDCGGDAQLSMHLIRDGELAVLAGEDLHIFSTLSLGGAGAIAASAHVHPELFVKMADCARDGRVKEARRIFYRLLPLIELLFAEPNPAPVKALLAEAGWIANELRAPMQISSAVLTQRLIAAHDDLSI